MAERYDTNNPRPSNSMKDLNDNALAQDDYINSSADTTVDRFGHPFKTVQGTARDAEERIKHAIDTSMREAGYKPVDSFDEGAELTAIGQALRWKASNNTFYSWRGPLPKIVSPGSNPSTTGGISRDTWVDVTDDLQTQNGTSIVYAGSQLSTQAELDLLNAAIPTDPYKKVYLTFIDDDTRVETYHAPLVTICHHQI